MGAPRGAATYLLMQVAPDADGGSIASSLPISLSRTFFRITLRARPEARA
jgi:hypothetical protein